MNFFRQVTMALFWQTSSRLVIAFLLTFYMVGCTSLKEPEIWPSVARPITAEVGKIAVGVCAAENIPIESPMTKKEAALVYGGSVGLSPLAHAQSEQDLIISLLWLPVGTVIGGTYGTLVGMNGKEISKVMEQLKPVAEYPWVEEVRKDLIITHGRNMKALENSFPAVPKLTKKNYLWEKRSNVPRVRPTELDLNECKQLGADTLLVLNWERGGFNPVGSGVNPELYLEMMVKGMLIQVKSQEVLGMARFHYRGEKQRRLMGSFGWIDYEGSIEEELHHGSKQIAEQITQWLKTTSNGQTK